MGRYPSRTNHGSRKALHIKNVILTLVCFVITFFVFQGAIVSIDNNVDHSNDDPRLSQSRKLEEVTNGDRRSLNDHAILNGNENISTLDMKATHKLGPKITNWDEKRIEFWQDKYSKSQIPIRDVTHADSKDVAISVPQFQRYDHNNNILLVTGSSPTACDSTSGAHVLLKAIKNKIDYCRLHGIPIFYNMAYWDDVMSGFWSKLPLLRTLMLSHPEVEWIWWMDSDAFFTDMSFKLPMERYQNHNIVLHGWEEMVYNRRSWYGLNTGSFLIRNCQWSLDLLDSWAPYGPKGPIRQAYGTLFAKFLSDRPQFEADDQSALVYLLIKERSRWSDKVYLESSYCLHGYWVPLVEQLFNNSSEGNSNIEKPFVTHFVGCKPCGSYGSYDVDRCLLEMEHAFNFADNQILDRYGLKHVNLSTPSINAIKH